MELIHPKKQNVWGNSAVALFTLGGSASGMYVLLFLAGILRNGTTDWQQPTVFKLVPPLMVFLGFLLISLEAGRPSRGLYAFLQLRSSWMSREVLSGTVFAAAALLDWIAPRQEVHVLALIAALLFMVSQAAILYDSRAVRSWNSFLMLWLSLTTSLAVGSGLILLIAGIEGVSSDNVLLLLGLSCITLNLLVWLLYIHDQTVDEEARNGLRRLKTLSLTVGIGQVTPIVTLFLILWRGGETFGGGFLPTLLAGLAVILGGVIQKKSIILEAGYLRGISLGLPRKIPRDTCMYHRDA